VAWELTGKEVHETLVTRGGESDNTAFDMSLIEKNYPRIIYGAPIFVRSSESSQCDHAAKGVQRNDLEDYARDRLVMALWSVSAHKETRCAHRCRSRKL
jgi:hypothetical protein